MYEVHLYQEQIDRLSESIAVRDKHIEALEAENKELRDRLDAVEQLAACYRMQRRPTEKLLKELDRTRVVMETLKK